MGWKGTEWTTVNYLILMRLPIVLLVLYVLSLSIATYIQNKLLQPAALLSHVLPRSCATYDAVLITKYFKQEREQTD